VALLVSSLKLSSFALMKPLRSKIVELMFWWRRAKTMPNHKLIRLSIALVWLYQGLWCKVLGGVPRQEAVISTVPFLGAREVRVALITLGLVECGLALWVLSGQRRRQGGIVQTALLIAMNSGGLIWAWHLIPDPVGMILQNFAFLVLVWIASEDRRYASHT